MNGQKTECQENRLKPSMGSENNNEINTHSVSLCCDLYTVMYSGWTDPGVN